MIALDTSKHESISKDAEFFECDFSFSTITILLYRVEQFLIENRDVLHATMITACAAVVGVHVPVQSRTTALFAEITGKWANVKETYKREKLADPILKWSSGQAPFVVSLQSEACLSRACGTLLISDQKTYDFDIMNNLP